jgi:hypothetical protein
MVEAALAVGSRDCQARLHRHPRDFGCAGSTHRTRGRSFRFLSFRIPLFRRRRPNRHGRTRGFAGSRRRTGAQQIGDPLEGGEHALVLVGRRRRPGRG